MELEMSSAALVDLREARRLYMGVGPDILPQEMPASSLAMVDDLLYPIKNPEAQELRGWVNIERMFQYPGEEGATQRNIVLENARHAFGQAYDTYGEIGYSFRQARLAVAAGSLALFDCWAAGRAVDDDTRQEALAMWGRAGEALIDSKGVKQEQQVQARTELVLLMARMAVRGDTRKPIQRMAVPATFRQRIGHLPAEIEQKQGRYNWDVSLLVFDQASQTWNLQGGIRVKTDYERAERVPLHKDILALSSQELLGDNGLHAINRSIRLFSGVAVPQQGEGPTKEQRKAATALHKHVERRIQEYKVEGFGVGVKQ